MLEEFTLQPVFDIVQSMPPLYNWFLNVSEVLTLNLFCMAGYFFTPKNTAWTLCHYIRKWEQTGCRYHWAIKRVLSTVVPSHFSDVQEVSACPLHNPWPPWPHRLAPYQSTAETRGDCHCCYWVGRLLHHPWGRPLFSFSSAQQPIQNRIQDSHYKGTGFLQLLMVTPRHWE